MSPKVTQKFGKYEITGELGQGGMGVVYKARDPVIGRLVALKTLTAEVLADPELLKRFYREAQSAGGLQHPNIVTIYDMGESEGRPYIAMEYVEGESLQKIISRRQSFPLALKLRIISQFCQGLDHAHKRGVIHRDVKPGNILVRSDGTVKVVDFGIAHLDSTTLTKTGVFMGTVNYSSPEQLNDGRVDVRSDLWSVAIVMYEFLAYHKPFEGSNFATLISKILNTSPEPLVQYCPEAPPELVSLISNCLEKDPAKRPQGLDQVLQELAPIEQSLRGPAVKDLVTQALDLWNKGDLNHAHEAVRNVLMLDSTHSEAISLMSRITEQIRRAESSSRLIQLVNEAERLLNQGDPAECLRSANEALKLSPTDSRALDLRSRGLAEQQRQKEARDAFAAGHKAFKMGDLTGAESELRKAVELDPRNPRATSLLDIVHEDRSTRAKSFDLKEAIWEAENRLNVGDVREARERLTRLLTENPGNEEVRKLYETAQQQSATMGGGQGREWLDQQLKAASQYLDAKDYDQATRVLSGVNNEFPNEPQVRQLQARISTAAPPPQAVAALGAPATPPMAAAPKSHTALVILIAAVVVVALAAVFIIHDLGHHQTAAPPSAQQLQLEQEAKALQQQGKPDEAVALWSALAAQSGPLQAAAAQAIDQIEKGAQQEKDLFQQAQAAQADKTWASAISLYTRVANLNGDMKSQALQAITNVKALQSGQDLSALERNKFNQAQAALGRQDFTRARDLFQQVVNLDVPGSALIPQARSQLAALQSRLQDQQDFSSAVALQNGGQLQQALAKFQGIVSQHGALSAQAQTHVSQIDQRLSAEQKQKAQAQAQALHANIAKFKDLESRNQFGQARALLALIGQQGGDAMQLASEVNNAEQASLQKLTDQFNRAVSGKNIQQLQHLASEFQALAAQGGPAASAAGDYASNRIPGELKQLTAKPEPVAPAPKAAARAPQVQVLSAGAYRPWPRPVSRNMEMAAIYIPNLKAISLTMPPVAGAPAGGSVIVAIKIDENGNVTPDRILNDTSGQGQAVLSACTHWKFTPPRVRSKPVHTGLSIEVTF